MKSHTLIQTLKIGLTNRKRQMMALPVNFTKYDMRSKLKGKMARFCKFLKLFLYKYFSYRNKCEFTIGINEENNLPTVGFRIGSYVNGITGVGPIDNLAHIPEAMKKAAKIFENFVRSSDLQVFNPEYHTGHFRQVMMRSAQDQLMLVVGIHPQDLSQEKLADFKRDLVNFFKDGAGKDAAVTSLYYQQITKKCVFCLFFELFIVGRFLIC